MNTRILDNNLVQKKLRRLTLQVLERNYESKSLLIVGIQGNGFAIAEQIFKLLQKNKNTPKTNLFELHLNKADFTATAINLHPSTKNFSTVDVIIVDDVLNTGRTMAHAIGFFLGKKVKSIQTLVLVDRDHKQFPIKADFIGYPLSTNLLEHIDVQINQNKVEAFLVD